MFFTHSGAYVETIFFQLPNHKKIILRLFLRAFSINPSIKSKWNSPSFGSTNSQETGVNTVFRFIWAKAGQIESIYFKLDELELCNSPASDKKGLSFTISLLTPSIDSMRGGIDSVPTGLLEFSREGLHAANTVRTRIDKK
ncbi:MAG TPA: hypothetical protein PLK12_08730 [Prolixibacteraceae bacterium]|nr:hypothetical protein [Prolixibacteraceae bacterium]